VAAHEWVASSSVLLSTLNPASLTLLYTARQLAKPNVYQRQCCRIANPVPKVVLAIFHIYHKEPLKCAALVQCHLHLIGVV
jgi:hypothetical protein